MAKKQVTGRWPWPDSRVRRRSSFVSGRLSRRFGQRTIRRRLLQGQSVFLVVGSGAGGGYDVYTRSLARYWGRHIPGNPTLVVQNMPGAGGITMMNYIANIAKPDGTIIGAGFANTVIEPVFDKGKVTKYDSRKLNWIGSISPQSIGCFTWGTNKVKTIEEAQKIPVIMATTGNSISAMSANIVNTMIGTKFKIVMGYTTAESTLAIERGEAEGTCLSSATIIAEHPDWIKEHKLNWLIVLSNKPDPVLPGTPIAAQLSRRTRTRKCSLSSSRSLLWGGLMFFRRALRPTGSRHCVSRSWRR